MFSVVAILLSRHDKLHLNNFLDWKEEKYNSEFMLFKKKMGTHLSIDETFLSQGELYTIVINKAAKGKKGSLVVIQQIEDQSTSYANEQRSYKCLFIYLQSSLKGRFYYCCFKARASFWLRCLPRLKWWFLYRKPRSEYSYKH